MREVAAVISHEGEALYWFSGLNSVSIPDSAMFWQWIWKNRHNISGIAHSHPGGGVPAPSQTDLTTFAAIDAALGRHLNWWIISRDAVVVCNNHVVYPYKPLQIPENQAWLKELRSLSYGER